MLVETESVSRHGWSATRLVALVELQQTLVRPELDFERALEIVADATAELCASDGAAVELRDGDDMVYVAATGIVADSLGLRLPVAGSLSGVSATERRIEQCTDSETDDRVARDACRRIGLRSMLIVPLVHAERSFGALKVVRRLPGRFSDDDVAILELAGGFIASALALRQTVSGLEQAERRFRMLFERAPTAMVLTSLLDESWGTILDANDAMARLLGRPLTDLLGQPFAVILGPDDAVADPRPIDEILAGTDVVETTQRLVRRDGAGVLCHSVGTIVRDEQSRPLYAVTQLRDIESEVADRQRLVELATTDPLTGIANRGRLSATFERLRAGTAGTSARVAAISIDLDEFKLINDTLGHAAGDEAIVMVADALSGASRATDTVVRMGGDEFVVLTAVDDEAGAAVFAGRLQDAVERLAFRPPLRISMGVAVGGPDPQLHELLGQADLHMYRNKRERRLRDS